MINVLIVDDERIIRDGIAQLIPWKNLNLNLVGKEKNGKNALTRIEDTTKASPDIIITDIKMPLMDGLKLIEQSRLNHPNIVFIVLSGFDDFEYAKSAMGYGVKYYLLKPTSVEEISDTLKKAINDVYIKRRTGELEDLSGVSLKAKKTYSDIVKKIIDAVDKHINYKELSLKWIAENIIYMNEDYLSKLFKKEVEKKFSDYLLSKKIAIAKERLLSGDEQKIYEVFEQLGFDTNSRYFSQVFKKYTGLTPTEYRRKFNP